jgi:hypothetical protein
LVQEIDFKISKKNDLKELHAGEQTKVITLFSSEDEYDFPSEESSGQILEQ